MDPQDTPTAPGGDGLDPADLSSLQPDNVQTWVQELGPKALELGTTYGLRIVGALIILVVAWILGGWARKAVVAVLQRTHTDGTVNAFVGTLVRWAVLVLGLILCLGAFGIETTSLAALLGGAGVGIGVALQGNLSNLASGLLLIAFRPFTEGDWVELESSGVDGRITSVGLLFTEIDTFSNQRVVLPNQLLFDQAITNHEYHPVRRSDLEVGVAYDTDLAKCDEILREVVARVQDEVGPDTAREPVVWWTGFGNSSINLKLGVWCTTGSVFITRNKLLLAVKDAFDANGIVIPFPQRDLHLKQPDTDALQELVAAK